jgi:AraC-like DNA-binding protein
LRSFTRQKGISPYSYLETIRIGKAKKLLEQGIPPIEVALQTGFTDQSHFSNFFKKFIGLTPKQYMNIFKEA